jgi:outer membrane protein OmpA-like peptidoglycan-associated protein
MNKLFILVGFTLNFSLLFSQECNKNVYSEDEATKLSTYGKNLEKSILEKNPADTALIAKLQGDYSQDGCGYSDDEVIKISKYLRELEKLDSINKIVPEPAPVVDTTPVVVPEPIVTPVVVAKSGTVLFASNSSQIKVAKLDELVSQLKADPKLSINLDGYTDATASSEFNLALSKRRSKAVKDYLISKGISASRISTNAHGESDPVAPNDTEEGKAQNRRVVVSIK